MVSSQPRPGHGTCGNGSHLRLASCHTEHADRGGIRLARRLFGYGIVILVGVTLLSMLVRDRPEPYGLRPDGDPPEEGASAEPLPAVRTAEQMPG